MNKLILLLLTGLSIYQILKLRKIMGSLADFQTVLARIDQATNNIAEKIRNLESQVQNLGLTPDQEASILSTITGVADQLEAIGKTDQNGDPVDPEQPQNTDEQGNPIP